MIGINHHVPGRGHSPGLLRRFYYRLRGAEQVLVRPAAELPLLLISCAKADLAGVDRLRQSVEETWLTLPENYRERYAAILEQAPPLVVVLLRRRNICGCLGHHHPPGSESRLVRRLRGLSGVRTGEIDLAFEAIREWEPSPLSQPALVSAADTAEMTSFRYQLALLTVFLHELHHLVASQEPEAVVRSRSQKFYGDVLADFVSRHFGVEYGLRRESDDAPAPFEDAPR